MKIFIVIIGVIAIVIWTLLKKENARRRADEAKKKKLIAWNQFLLGSDKIKDFKTKVGLKRREINLRYSKYGCMRLILPNNIDFRLADALVEKFKEIGLESFWIPQALEESGFFQDCDVKKWVFEIDRPMASFASFITEMYVEDCRIHLAIKILETGEVVLCMDGKKMKYQEMDFKSWDDMLKFLDKKIGIES